MIFAPSSAAVCESGGTPAPPAAAIVHRAVLLGEAADGLAIKRDGVYLDGTFGGGGHSREILRRLGDGGALIALDVDPAAERCAAAIADPRLRFFRRNFSAMESALAEAGFAAADGVLLDLGVSAMQLEDPARGFSFLRAGPLDMRMDPDAPRSAADLLQTIAERDLADALFALGGERGARRIARAIVGARGALRTTADLAGVVARAAGGGGRIHPATRAFQTLRLLVNQELESLACGLSAAEKILAPGGRLAAVSFHSGEDRPVKLFLRESAVLRPLGKVVRPDAAEIAANPRARSAKLRIGEKA